MKITKIALACALACSAMSAQAASVAIPAGTKVVYLSGATAPDNFLQDIATNMMTGVTSITSGTNYRAFLGKASGITGVANGTDILFIKRSKGGSVWGVDPVARANRIETLDFNNCTAVTATSYTCGVKGIDPGLAGNEDAGNPGMVPDFGVSDVEAKMFKEPYNTENNQPALSSTEVGVLEAKPVNQIMMGIVATNAVPDTTHISRSAYGAMLAGKIRTWDQLDATLPADPVTVCRRVDGSGTQTSYNWFFSGFPCTDTYGGHGETPPASVTDSDGVTGLGSGTSADPYIIDPTWGYTVVENSTSGDVKNCLKAAQNGGVHKVKGENDVWYQVTFPAATKAIGVLSLDSYKDVSTANGWNFRMLDGKGTYTVGKNVGTTPVMNADAASAGATGIAPSKDNLLDGKYDFTVELSMQYRKDAVTNVNGDAVAPLTADAVKTAIVNEFIKRAGDPKYTGNDGIPAAGTAVTSVPKAYASLPQYYDYSTKPAYVSKYSRNANTCAPMVRY